MTDEKPQNDKEKEEQDVDIIEEGDESEEKRAICCTGPALILR